MNWYYCMCHHPSPMTGTYRLNCEWRGWGGGGWRAGGEAISSMFIGEFVRDFIHQCLKKQHAVDKSELYDLHGLEEILAHNSPKIMLAHTYGAWKVTPPPSLSSSYPCF